MCLLSFFVFLHQSINTESIMVKHPLWSDEYWLLLMQLYMKKPVGVKPLYSRSIVDLSLELHIPPQFLYEQMFKLRMVTPKMERLWDTFGKNPRKLAKEVDLLRNMKGYGNAEKFYEGVNIKESFEKDWKPINGYPNLTNIKLILILDLYFQLTPITMVPETPEIIDLGKLIHVEPVLISEVLQVYQFCDPYLNRDDLMISPLLAPCQSIWNKFGNDNPKILYDLATQLKEYYK